VWLDAAPAYNIIKETRNVPLKPESDFAFPCHKNLTDATQNRRLSSMRRPSVA
jgi:hypothetical protein